MTDSIRAFFERSKAVLATYRWHRDDSNAVGAALERLVSQLGERIMRYRCRGQPGRFEAWRERRDGGPAADETTRRALEIVVGTAVGLPGSPKSRDHVEAFVAEHLWYFLTLEADPDECIVRVQGPSVEVTEIGGDGLTIHRESKDAISFRLWEIKKYSGTGSAASTVSGACRQLEANALRYLNKFSLLGQQEADEQIARLYGELLDHWLEATSEASAGVGLGTSSRAITNRSFQSLPKSFPRLVSPPRLQGCAAAIDDFSAFVERVRDELWKGL